MTGSDDGERLERLEREMAELRQELGDVRAALVALRGAGAAPNAGEGAMHAASRAEAAPHATRAPARSARDDGAIDVTASPPASARPAWGAAVPPRGAAPGGEPRPHSLAGIDLGVLRRSLDGEGLEDLVGRYGTVALAALLILMGVGAFLTWAVARFTLGPASRVALGGMLAIVLAIAGLRLRARDGGAAGGARRFGDTLLAIALAVAHVDAWGAGPYLGLVPSAVALAMAAAASVALALLAWRAGQQALFVVGVGGALVAPFVTAADRGDPFVLPIYGLVVLATAAAALPRRDAQAPWDVAATTLAVGGAGYAVSMLGDATAIAGIGNPAGVPLPMWELRRDLPALFAVASGVASLALGGRAYGGRIALSHLATALVALAALALAVSGGAPSLAALAFVATGAFYVALERLHPAAPRVDVGHAAVPGHGGVPQRALGAVGYPLGFLFSAVASLARPLSPTGAALGAAWAALAAVVAWRATARTRTPSPTDDDGDALALVAAHVATSLLASALVPLLLLRQHDVAQAAGLAVHAIVGAVVLARVRHGLVAAAVAGELTFASALAWSLLDDRPAYRYAPFATAESAAAAACVAGWAALAWAAWRMWRAERDARGATALSAWNAAGEPAWHAALVAAAPAAALLWGREELARAVSPDVSTFLLVGYFATAGIVAIRVGRGRAIAAARVVGLALALYAAAKALAQVSQLDAIGLKVGSYLLVGCFLLAVGWWYRGERGGGERVRR